MPQPNLYGTEQPLQSRGVRALTPISAGEAQVFDTSGFVQRSDQLAANDKREKAIESQQEEQAKTKALYENAKLLSKAKGFTKYKVPANEAIQKAYSIINKNPYGIARPKSAEDFDDIIALENAQNEVENFSEKQKEFQKMLTIKQQEISKIEQSGDGVTKKSLDAFNDYMSNPDNETPPEIVPNVPITKVADELKGNPLNKFYNKFREPIKDSLYDQTYDVFNETAFKDRMGAELSDPHSKAYKGLQTFIDNQTPENQQKFKQDPRIAFDAYTNEVKKFFPDKIQGQQEVNTDRKDKKDFEQAIILKKTPGAKEEDSVHADTTTNSKLIINYGGVTKVLNAAESFSPTIGKTEKPLVVRTQIIKAIDPNTGEEVDDLDEKDYKVSRFIKTYFDVKTKQLVNKDEVSDKNKSNIIMRKYVVLSDDKDGRTLVTPLANISSSIDELQAKHPDIKKRIWGNYGDEKINNILSSSSLESKSSGLSGIFKKK